jgi:hypothetical protein
MKKDSLFVFCCVLGMFLYSYIINQYALFGDQLYYRKVYEYMQNKRLVEAYLFYNANLDSKEFIHFILSWMSSNLGIHKDIFISVVNSIFIYISVNLMLKLNASKIIIVILLFTSFYFNVLYFSAERLKFGILFLLFSFYYIKYNKRYYLFFLLSVLSHAQVFIVYISMYFAFAIKQFKKMVTTGYISYAFLFSLLVGILGFVAVAPQIFHKINRYTDQGSIVGILKLVILLLLTLYYSKKDKGMIFFTFIPLIIVAGVIGAERTFILGYFVFLYFALQDNRGLNLGIVSLSIYTFIKSIDYLYKVIEFGDGFYKTL